MPRNGCCCTGLQMHGGGLYESTLHVDFCMICKQVCHRLCKTKDVNSAMEASRKSQNAFAVANVNPEDAQNKGGLISVKKVIDLCFQNVEDILHLVQLAFTAVNRQGFNGNRD